MILDCFLVFLRCIHLGQDIGAIHQGKGILHLTSLLLGIGYYFINNLKSLLEVALLRKALSLEDEYLHVPRCFPIIPVVISHLLIVFLLVILRLVEGVQCIIEVGLGHESLGKGDHYVHLNQLSLGHFGRELFDLMQREGEMLDGLLDALEAQVGLSKVIMGQDQSEIRLAIVEHKQLAQRQLLYPDIDQLFPCLGTSRMVEIVELPQQIPHNSLCIFPSIQ